MSCRILYNANIIERDIFSVFSTCNKLYNIFTTPTCVVSVFLIQKRNTANVRSEE